MTITFIFFLRFGALKALGTRIFNWHCYWIPQSAGKLQSEHSFKL